MMTGRVNVVLGLVAMILSAFGGFALGLTVDQYFEHGYAQIPFWRYLIKSGHSHGMPFGIINILFGVMIQRSNARRMRLSASG